MFRLRFSNRFKADTKKIVSIEEYLDLPMREARKCMVQPKSKEELEEVLEKVITEFGNKADLNFIDTHHITDMGELFMDSPFNGNISDWDVSNVKNMESMFLRSDFNGNISKWDVSNVEKMYDMFAYSEFDGDVSKWKINTDQTTRMFSHSPLRDKWGANAEILRGETLHLTSQEMVALLKKIDSYIRRKYSSDFEKIKDSEIVDDDPHLGAINIYVKDDYLRDRIQYHAGDGSLENPGLEIDVWSEGYELSDTNNPALEFGVIDEFDNFHLTAGYIDIDMSKINESGYLEKKIDEGMKELWDWVG